MKLQQFLALGAMSALATSAFGQTHVTADIASNTTWTAAAGPYILDKVIYVTGGAILDIEPGTIIRGNPRGPGPLEDAGSLIVTRGSKIQARGTSAAPIIFTTAAVIDRSPAFPAVDVISRWTPGTPLPFLDPTPSTAPLPPLMDLTGDGSADQKVMQLWGGLVLCGYAQTNNYQDVDGDTIPEDGVGLIEGLSGTNATYGGLLDEDDSGIVKYVSIRHGGDGVVVAKEINALTLYSVGSKTTISYVDVYCTSDDGVEVFGGNVNLDHLNINYADDDGFDVDEGYRGTAQFIFVLQGLGYGDKCLELDGDDWDESQALAPLFPISDVQIRQGTFISRATKDATDIKNGFNGSIINSILWKEGSAANLGISIVGLGGGDTAPSPSDYFESGSLQVRNVTAYNFATAFSVLPVVGGVDTTAGGLLSGTFAGAAIPSVFFPASTNKTSNPTFSITHEVLVNAVPPSGSLAASPSQDFNYVRDSGIFTTYRGAFVPGAPTQWTFGWTALNVRGILAN